MSQRFVGGLGLGGHAVQGFAPSDVVTFADGVPTLAQPYLAFRVNAAATYILNKIDPTTNDTFVAGAGVLDDATYYYRVTALNWKGETLASTETSLAVSAGAGLNGVLVKWNAVVGAASYKVYGRSTGAELFMAEVDAPTVQWLDDGSVTPAGALPGADTTGSTSVSCQAGAVTVIAPEVKSIEFTGATVAEVMLA